MGSQHFSNAFATLHGPNYLKSKFFSRSAKRAKYDYNDSTAVQRSRSNSRAPRDESGVRDPEVRKKLKKMEKKMMAKTLNRQGKAGESDRHIHEKKPKHLFSGKRKNGKTDRR